MYTPLSYFHSISQNLTVAIFVLRLTLLVLSVVVSALRVVFTSLKANVYSGSSGPVLRTLCFHNRGQVYSLAGDSHML